MWTTDRTPGVTILLVSFVGAATLVVPNFPAMGGVHRAAVPLGFLGSQGVTLLWVTLRWDVQERRVARYSLKRSLVFGAGGGVVLCLVATIPVVLLVLADARRAVPLLWVYPAYLVGTTVAAVFFWLLQD